MEFNLPMSCPVWYRSTYYVLYIDVSVESGLKDKQFSVEVREVSGWMARSPAVELEAMNEFVTEVEC